MEMQVKNKNKLAVRLITDREFDELKGGLYLFDGGVTDILEDQIDDVARKFVITREGGARYPSHAAAMLLPPEPPEVVDEGLENLADIVAIGHLWILSTKEEIGSYLDNDFVDKFIPYDGRPLMYLAGVYVPHEQEAFASIWALALEFARQLDVSRIVAHESTDFSQEIKGQQQWWHQDDETQDVAIYSQHKPDGFAIALKVVPCESFSSALEALQEQGISIPTGYEKLVTWIEK